MDSAPSVPRGRLGYLDWLRFLVVLSLAPFHAAISFTGLGSVYVYDTPVRDILLAGGTPTNMGPGVFRYYTIFMDNWFMHLLFFVSGIGAALSLRKRSGAQFMGERCTRLLLPFVLGTLLVVSFQTRLGALSFGKYSGSFLFFFPLFFSENFNWGISGSCSICLFSPHWRCRCSLLSGTRVKNLASIQRRAVLPQCR